jgi:phosphoribosylanthranilate isomerase
MSEVKFKNIIQVAGIIDQEEADMLITAGVDYLGFPLRLPVNKEDLSEEEAAEIIKSIHPPNNAVVISYSDTAVEAVELCKKLKCKIIQLHGQIEIDELIKIKSIEPEIIIIKSLVITGNNENELVKTVKETELIVDAYITDTYDPKTKASGATGKTHNWQISKNLVELSAKPVILAGGLNPENVFEAIIKVKPAGVDVHTGIENKAGRKDYHLLHKFVDEAKKAFGELQNDH